VTFFFGPGFRLRVADAVAAQDILVRHAEKFRKPTLMTTVLAPLLGDRGMLLAEGASHKHQRCAANSAFEFAGLQSMVPYMQKVAADAVAVWMREQQQEQPDASFERPWIHVPDIVPRIASLTLGIIGRAAFPTLRTGVGSNVMGTAAASDSAAGGGMLSTGSPFATLPEVLEELVLVARRMLVFIPFWQHLPLPNLIRLKARIARLRSVADDVIASARASVMTSAEC
jgi:hypothetical protein